MAVDAVINTALSTTTCKAKPCGEMLQLEFCSTYPKMKTFVLRFLITCSHRSTIKHLFFPQLQSSITSSTLPPRPLSPQALPLPPPSSPHSSSAWFGIS